MGNVHIHINTGGSANAAPKKAAKGPAAATRPQQQAQPARTASQMAAPPIPNQVIPVPQQAAPIVPSPAPPGQSLGATKVGVGKSNPKPLTPTSASKTKTSATSPAKKPSSSTSSSTPKTPNTSGNKKASSPPSSSASKSSSSSTTKPKVKSSSTGASKAKPKATGQTLGLQQQQTPAGQAQQGSLLGANGGNFMPGAGQLPPTAQSPQPAQQLAQQKPPVAQSPGKEPKAPPDVDEARDQQDTVLRQRQAREVQGKLRGGPRDVDAGSGFWPPLSPTL